MHNHIVSAGLNVEIKDGYSEKNTLGRYVSLVNSLFWGIKSENRHCAIGITYLKRCVAA